MLETMHSKTDSTALPLFCYWEVLAFRGTKAEDNYKVSVFPFAFFHNHFILGACQKLDCEVRVRFAFSAHLSFFIEILQSNLIHNPRNFLKLQVTHPCAARISQISWERQ